MASELLLVTRHQNNLQQPTGSDEACQLGGGELQVISHHEYHHLHILIVMIIIFAF